MTFLTELAQAEYILVSGDTITTHFTWDEEESDDLDEVNLAIYIHDCDASNELLFTNKDIRLAKRVGDAWIIGGLRLEFCMITPIVTRRDRLVQTSIGLRDARNKIIRELCIVTDEVEIELIDMQAKHMQHHLNELELKIQQLDFPDYEAERG